MRKLAITGAAKSIPRGSMKRYEIEGRQILIGKTSLGNYFAVQAECPHKGGPLAKGELEGDVLTCPWHSYQYNVLSGRLLKITYGAQYGTWRESADLDTYKIHEDPKGDLVLILEEK